MSGSSLHYVSHFTIQTIRRFTLEKNSCNPTRPRETRMTTTLISTFSMMGRTILRAGARRNALVRFLQWSFNSTEIFLNQISSPFRALDKRRAPTVHKRFRALWERLEEDRLFDQNADRRTNSHSCSEVLLEAIQSQTKRRTRSRIRN